MGFGRRLLCREVSRLNRGRDILLLGWIGLFLHRILVLFLEGCRKLFDREGSMLSRDRGIFLLGWIGVGLF